MPVELLRGSRARQGRSPRGARKEIYISFLLAFSLSPAVPAAEIVFFFLFMVCGEIHQGKKSLSRCGLSCAKTTITVPKSEAKAFLSTQ